MAMRHIESLLNYRYPPHKFTTMKKISKEILYPRLIFRKTLALQTLKPYLNETNNFLEVGAGNGDFAETISKHIPRGTVLDFSSQSIEILKNRFEGTDIKVMQADFLDCDFTEKYSLVLMFEMLEHISNDGSILDKIHNLLVDGGYFMFSVPARMKYWAYTDEFAGHYRRYEKDSLKKLLEDHGYNVISLISYGFPLINFTSFLRNFVLKNDGIFKYTGDKKELTKQSGMMNTRMQKKKITTFIVKILFNPLFVVLYINMLKIFVPLNLGDGYLCLAKKK